MDVPFSAHTHNTSRIGAHIGSWVKGCSTDTLSSPSLPWSSWSFGVDVEGRPLAYHARRDHEIVITKEHISWTRGRGDVDSSTLALIFRPLILIQTLKLALFSVQSRESELSWP